MGIIENIEKIRIIEFDTSSETQNYLAEYEDRHFEISASVAQLITILKEVETISTVVERFRGSNGKRYSKEEITVIIQKYIEPILKSIELKKQQPLLFRIQLLAPNKIEVLSNALKFLFFKWNILIISTISVFLDVIFMIYTPKVLQIQGLNLYVILGMLFLMLFSSFVHEIGHASACKYYNALQGGIGFGLYLNFPVFYTDVSDIWRLPQKQRLIVNLAGVYFQLIMLIPLFILGLITHSNIVNYFLLMININIIITLNPFFKYDGYWLISDLLGVANLRQRSNELISYALKKLTHKPIKQKPYLFHINKRKKILFLFYSIVVNIFFGYYFVYIIPLFLNKFFNSFPGLIEQLVSGLAIGETPDFHLLQSIFIQLLFFILIVFSCFRILIMPLLKQLKANKNRKCQN